MIDTHCHLNLDPLQQDWQKYLHQAQLAGVTKIIIPGVDQLTSQTAINIASKSESCFAAVGIHPHEAEKILTDGTNLNQIFNSFIAYCQQKQAIAIGECGLDYFNLPQDPLKQKHIKAAQKKLFLLHLEAAQKAQVSILVHIRDAHDDALDLITQFSLPTVLHCFSGTADFLTKALKQNCYISFAGNLTFNNAKDLQSVLLQIPLDKLLIETDSPYLNPIRGVFPNQPQNITTIYTFIANKLSLSLEELQQQIAQNVHTLFGV